MRKIDYIVIHHSGLDYGDAALIDKWHRERGFRKIGYHYVILNGYRRLYSRAEVEELYSYEDDGRVEEGRSLEEVGAHVRGYNENSIGICLIGCFTFTVNQLLSLKALLQQLKDQFPDARIVGHNDLDPVNKANCPGFNVEALLAEFGIE